MAPLARLNPQSLRHALTMAGLLALLGVAIGGLQWRQFQALQAVATGAQGPEQLRLQEDQDRLRLSLLRRMPSFGYDNLIANWTFLNFLQYFGNVDARLQVGYTVSPEFFEVIVDRDPRFVTPYLYLSASTSLFAGQPERTIEMMQRGLTSMTPTLPSGGYRVWRFLGIDQLLFLGDGDAARQSFITAAEWADQSDEPEAASVAEASRQTAAFLTENSASRAAQISAWVQVINLAVDDQVRQIAVERIQALGGEILDLGQGRITVRYRTDE
ncbi:hypothetical protein GFS31_33360 [Leptolyngbya sp. BL0902]|uniref:hypothetical protein n=1 Tax=Leptolyngbya sp. BL0902 TaxID=1115757 RepID=UPI0018E89D04|nr:hypothetical protein [Leptolyngbya sp. BL0902]QQE66636.1 hypothetical protein GFS31_33360 [Leptolyngbya sp. BL0902]